MIQHGYELAPGVKILFQTTGPYSHFFGYYDKSPLDFDGKRLLCHRVGFDGRDVGPDDQAVIGYWEIETGKFTDIGVTPAFNWQQGAMLQWLPPDYSTRIIYNNRGPDGFMSTIVDMETGRKRDLPCPVYAVHPSGGFALCANFERLYFCRPGYNYQGVVKPEWDCPIHEGDGIFSLDLKTGDRKLIIRTRDICNIAPLPEFDRVYNWLEHMMWNPSGSRFAFLHRWETGDGGHKTRLYTANAEGGDIFAFPDSGFYSHMGWRNDEEFTIWALKPSAMLRAHEAATHGQSKIFPHLLTLYRKLVKPILKDKIHRKAVNGSFFHVWDKTARIEVLGPAVLSENGHNTWTDDGRYMLTDTYPDPSTGIQNLYLYDSENNFLHSLGSFYSPYYGGGYRCDLHPRFGTSCDRIVIDTLCLKETRMVCILSFDWSIFLS